MSASRYLSKDTRKSEQYTYYNELYGGSYYAGYTTNGYIRNSGLYTKYTYYTSKVYWVISHYIFSKSYAGQTYMSNHIGAETLTINNYNVSSFNYRYYKDASAQDPGAPAYMRYLAYVIDSFNGGSGVYNFNHAIAGNIWVPGSTVYAYSYQSSTHDFERGYYADFLTMRGLYANGSTNYATYTSTDYYWIDILQYKQYYGYYYYYTGPFTGYNYAYTRSYIKG